MFLAQGIFNAVSAGVNELTQVGTYRELLDLPVHLPILQNRSSHLVWDSLHLDRPAGNAASRTCLSPVTRAGYTASCLEFYVGAGESALGFTNSPTELDTHPL